MAWGGPLTSTVWLFFLVPPIIKLVHTRPLGWHTLVMLALAFTVAILFLKLTLKDPYSRLNPNHPDVRRSLPMLLVMAVLSVLGPLIGGADWLGFMIYTSAAAGLRLPSKVGLWMIAALLVLTVFVNVSIGSSWQYLGQSVILVGAIGLLTSGIVMLVDTIHELERAREELARLAVAEERLRLARDLHDLLGHSLSLIAVKSELAKHLVKRDVDKTLTEIEDIERVSRDALADVRSAVSGYRQLSRVRELSSAKELLTAASITLEIRDGVDNVPADIESVLAWTIREGVTNVIRHGQAGRCCIAIEWADGGVHCEVQNDARTPSTRAMHGEPVTAGNGLTGLAERVHGCSGQMQTTNLSGGGFLLAVTLPIRQPNCAERRCQADDPITVG